MAIYLTGDKHRNFTSVESFCKREKTTKEDTLIVLGDAGVNYTGTQDDLKYKKYLESLPITFMFIRGNHEMRPSQITYQTRWNYHNQIKGPFLIEPEFPSLLFAKDGEFYMVVNENKEIRPIFVCGGAYSIDKTYRLANHLRWFSDEQLTQVEMQCVEKHFQNISVLTNSETPHKELAVLTHTCPRSVVPRHALMPGIDSSLEDWSMENFFDSLKDELGSLPFTWYCGHFHVDETNRIGDNQNFRFMYHDFIELR